MGETRHTPGPWVVRDTLDGRRPQVYVTREFGSGVPPKFYIAFLPQMDAGDSLADAHLIAAAPELLEAARAVRDSVSALLPFSLNELPAAQEVRAELAMKLGMAHGLVLAAIAKAEGRS